MNSKNFKTGDEIYWVPRNQPLSPDYPGILEDYDEYSDSWTIKWEDGYENHMHYWPEQEIYPRSSVDEIPRAGGE